MIGGYTLNFKREAGFTLLELLISIVLVGILFSFYFSFIINGFEQIDVSASKSEIQSNIRIASIILQKEIPNTVEIELLDSVDNESGYNYISHNNNSFKLERENGSTKTIGMGNISSISFEVNEIIDEDSLYNYYLQYEIQSEKNNQNYNISSRILLNNLSSDGLKSSTGIGKSVIKYKSP